MKLKVSKVMLESALIFSAKSDVRYYLNGLCFKPGGVFTSTDGYRLFYGQHINDNENEVIVSNVKSPTKKYSEAVFDTETGIVDFNDDFGIKVGVAIFTVVGGRFPDVERVIPKSFQAIDSIGFNAGYLASIEKAAKLFNNRWHSVKIQFSGASSSAVCELKTPAGEVGKIVLMPMRLD